MPLELYPFQAEGAAYLRSRRRGALFDDPGTGKTVQAIAALPPTPRVVIVCPKIARYVWSDHLIAMRPDISIEHLRGRGSFRRYPERSEALLLNYELLPTEEWVNYASPAAGITLIADEAHYLKTGNSQRTRRWRALADTVLRFGGTVWVLTGTPQLGEPVDLWHVLRAAQLEKDVFGDWQRFRVAYGARDTLIRARGRQVRKTVYGTAAPWVRGALRRVVLRRTRDEVLPELPQKIRSSVRLDCLDREAIDLCDEALRKLQELDADPEQALEIALDNQDALRLESVAKARRALSVLKVAAAKELLDEYETARRPVVLFSSFRAPVQWVAATRNRWACIVGGTPDHIRSAIIAGFQNGTYVGLAGTFGAMATAITLTKASDVICLDLDWTPAVVAQAEDRVCRIGQLAPRVLVTTLVATHILDAAVCRVLARKAASVASAL